MKQITTYINEKLRLTNKRTYTCQPKDRDELRDIILQRIKDEGNKCDLNDIDTSKIKDMSYLFDARPPVVGGNPIFKDFNGDISMWNVSNVKNMCLMFCYCEKFNCDISQWNVSNVEKMNGMFYGCKKIDCDLSYWDVSYVIDMTQMFYGCERFNCDLSKWDVSNVKGMYSMFNECKRFRQDLDSWNVSHVENMMYAFKYCPTKPTWYDRKRWEY